MKGWVYVISNKAMPGIVIVGCSPTDPRLQAGELNQKETSPTYTVEYEILTEDPLGIERRAHRQLFHLHEGQGRYKCTVEHAIFIVQQVAGESFIYEKFRALPITLTQQPLETAARQEGDDHDIAEGRAASNSQYVHIDDSNREEEKAAHAAFVEKYHSRKIAVDIDEYKAGFMYEQPDLIPQKFRSRQTLMRNLALGGFLLSVAIAVFVPWWVTLAVLSGAICLVPHAQKNAAKGVLQAALRDPHVYHRAVEKQVLVIRGFV